MSSDLRKLINIIKEGEIVPFKAKPSQPKAIVVKGQFKGFKAKPVGQPKYAHNIRVVKTDDGFIVFVGNEKYGIYNDPAKAHSVALNLQDKFDDDY